MSKIKQMADYLDTINETIITDKNTRGFQIKKIKDSEILIKTSTSYFNIIIMTTKNNFYAIDSTGYYKLEEHDMNNLVVGEFKRPKQIDFSTFLDSTVQFIYELLNK